MEIKRVGTQPSVKGPSEWFTGTVRIDPLFQHRIRRWSRRQRNFRTGGGDGMAYASARADSHRHGWLWPRATLGRSIEEIRPGDVVWFSPDEKHCTALRRRRA